MKLIFCDTCWDIFKLSTEEIRSCECGKCCGCYLPDGHHAEVNGEGFSLAIGNGSLVQAIKNMQTHEGESKEDYINVAGIKYAWARPMKDRVILGVL